MKSFSFSSRALPGLGLLQRRVQIDARGRFEKLYCADQLRAFTRNKPLSQVNRTVTRQAGTVRGLHFQRPPHAEFKFVTCLRGKVFDVVVDVRADSPSLLGWHSEVLHADDCATLVVPPGFAHGFQALTDDVELLYFHTEAYVPESEGGLLVDDPFLAIPWPMAPKGLSERDQQFSPLTCDFEGILV